MAHEFCMNCGFKVEYTLKKPNFCPNCGDGIGAVEAASVDQPVEEEAEANVSLRPTLTQGLQYEINGKTSNVTMGDLFQQAQVDPTNSPSSVERPLPPPGEKDGLRESMDSCLSSRETTDIGGQKE